MHSFSFLTRSAANGQADPASLAAPAPPPHVCAMREPSICKTSQFRRPGVRGALRSAIDSESFQLDYGGNKFIVRRPHHPSMGDVFWSETAGVLDAVSYAQTADILDPESLEVAVNIEVDGSVFTLFGKDNIRYQQTRTGKVTDFYYCSEAQVPLRDVVYTDEDGTDHTYSLQWLFLNAERVRRLYALQALNSILETVQWNRTFWFAIWMFGWTGFVLLFDRILFHKKSIDTV